MMPMDSPPDEVAAGERVAQLGALSEDMAAAGNVLLRPVSPDVQHPFHVAAAEHVPAQVPSVADVVAAAAIPSTRAALGGMTDLPDDRRLNAVPDPDVAFGVGEVAAAQLADVASPVLSGSDKAAVWKAGLGRRLVEEVGEHSDAAPMYQSPAQAERASVAFELASFAESAKAGRLAGESGGKLAGMVGRLDRLEPLEMQELADAVVTHAKLTEPFVHPEMAVTPGVQVRKVDVDEGSLTLGVRPVGPSTDVGSRVDMLGFAPQWLTEQGAYGLMDAFDDYPDAEPSDDRSAVPELVAGTKADWLDQMPDVSAQALRSAAVQLSEQEAREVSEAEVAGAALAASADRNVHHRRVLDTLAGSENPTGKMPRESVMAGWDKIRSEVSAGTVDGPTDVELKLLPDGTVEATGRGRAPRGLRNSGLVNAEGREMLAPWVPLPLSSDAKQFVDSQPPSDLPVYMLNGDLSERVAGGGLAVQLTAPLRSTEGASMDGGSLLKSWVGRLKQRGFQFEVEEQTPFESKEGQLLPDGEAVSVLVPKQSVTLFPAMASDLNRMVSLLSEMDEPEVVVWPGVGMDLPEGFDGVEADVFSDGTRSVVQLNRNQTRTSVPVWVKYQGDDVPAVEQDTVWSPLPDGTLNVGGRALLRPQPSETAAEVDPAVGVEGFVWEGDQADQISVDGVSPSPQITVGHSTHAPVPERDGALLLNREGNRWVPADREQVWLLDAANIALAPVGVEVSL